MSSISALPAFPSSRRSMTEARSTYLSATAPASRWCITWTAASSPQGVWINSLPPCASCRKRAENWARTNCISSPRRRCAPWRISRKRARKCLSARAFPSISFREKRKRTAITSPIPVTVCIPIPSFWTWAAPAWKCARWTAESGTISISGSFTCTTSLSRASSLRRKRQSASKNIWNIALTRRSSPRKGKFPRWSWWAQTPMPCTICTPNCTERRKTACAQ